MERNHRYENIFTPEAKEYLLRLSTPSVTEVERVKERIFSQLDVKYPQVKHRFFLSVDNIRLTKFIFASSLLLFIIGISGYVTFSLFHKNTTSQDTAVVPGRTITPNQTVLVQNSHRNMLNPNDDGMKTERSGSSVVDIKKEVKKQGEERAGRIQALRGIRSIPPVQDKSVSHNRGGQSLVRGEGSVSAASGKGKQAILEGIDNSLQIEYVVEIR